MNGRAAAALIVLALIAGASAEYGVSTIGARNVTKTTTSLVTSTATSTITTTSPVTSTATSTVTSTTTELPCSQATFGGLQDKWGEPKAQLNVSASTNGTGTAETFFPVLTLAPGSEGSFCVTYTDTSGAALTDLSYSAYDWNYNPESQGVDQSPNVYPAPDPNALPVTESPADAVVQPNQILTVLYTVNASGISAGEYGLVADNVSDLESPCGSFQLIVGNSTSGSSLSKFPGLVDDLDGAGFSTCPSPPPYGILSGFSGMGVTYLENKTQFDIPFRETSRSIQSVVESPTEQNVTITLGLQTYALPITVGQPSGCCGYDSSNDYSYIANWRGNPELTPTPGDACDWVVGNATERGQEIGLVGPPPPDGVTVNARTLNFPPHSNVTYTYSVEISNLTGGNGGYLSSPTPVKGGYFATELSVLVYWDGEVDGPDGLADLAVSQFLPVGQIGQSVDGACTAPAMELENTPWYLRYVMPTGDPQPEPFSTALAASALPNMTGALIVVDDWSAIRCKVCLTDPKPFLMTS